MRDGMEKKVSECLWDIHRRAKVTRVPEAMTKQLRKTGEIVRRAGGTWQRTRRRTSRSRAWWKAKEIKWAPHLAKMGKQYFAAPASSAGVERVFSAAGKNARCMATSKSRGQKDTTLEHSLNLPPSTQTSALRLPILPKGAGEGFISGFVPYLHTLIPN